MKGRAAQPYPTRRSEARRNSGPPRLSRYDRRVPRPEPDPTHRLGRFSPEKNCDLLIDAFEKAQTPIKLVLAGGSSHTEKYVAHLRKHESDQIKFLDWLSGDALEEVLTNAALFVLPSDLEGLSLALLDAMGCGRVCAGQRCARELRSHRRHWLRLQARRYK